MRKISLNPLKRGLFSVLGLTALIFIGLGLVKAEDAPFNQEFKVEYSGTGIEYHFVAPSTGQLNINFNAPSGINGDIDFLFTASDKKAVQLVSHDGVVDQWGPPFPTNIYNAVYNVTEGTEYYVKLPYYDGNLTLSMVDGGNTGGGTDPVDPDPTPGGGDVTVGGSLALNTPYSVTDDNTLTGTISFDKNGELTATYTEGGGPIGMSPWDEILFTDASYQNPVALEGFSGKQVYNVKAGTTYYVKAGIAASGMTTPGAPFGFPFEVTFTFEVKEGNIEVGDVPEGYEPMPVVNGPLSNPQQSDAAQITASGNFYFFQAPSDGKLVVWQWGSSRVDGHLWKVPFQNDNWEPWGSHVEGSSPLGDEGTPTPNYITYALSEGQSYYWYANSGLGITYAIFAWEGTDLSAIPTISLDTPTTVASNALYQFTATESGVLAVDLSSPTAENVSFSTGLAALPAEQHFLYSNSGHSEEVQALATSGGAEGWHVAFEVEAGVTYYVYNPTLYSVIFTLSMDPNGAVNPKLEAVQPLPGGIDNNAQETTITVQFYPAAVSIASVDFVYTDLQGQLQTIQNVQCDFLSGAYNIPRPQHMNMDGTKLHEAYDDPNATVYYQISKAEGSVQRYILHQVNYNGKPLAETAITAGVDIAADGTLTLNYSIDTPPTLVSQVVPDPFYHEWTAGDPAGIMVLTYNKELNPAYTPEVNIIEGNQYYGSEPGENDQMWAVNPTHIKVEGNTVTVDFTGSDAFLTAEEEVDGVPTSIPWGPGRSNITIYVGGVMGMNNLPASYSGDPAFMPHVTYVSQDAPEPEPVAADIVKVTPAYGSVIYVEEDGSSSFEITFNQDVTVNWVGTYNRMNRQHAATYETSPAFGESAKVWKVIIPAKDIEEAMRDNDENASIWAYVEAVDKNGEVVQGSSTLEGDNRVDNYGDSFALWFNVEHAENPGMPFVTSLEAGDNEAPLRSFTVSSEWGTVNANNEDGANNVFTQITVTGPNDFTANAESFDISTRSVVLDKAITAEGEYEITFPYQAFTIIAPEEDGISKTYDSEERSFTFTVVLGDEIYDSQVDDIQLTAQPAHGETEEEAAPVTQDDIQNVVLSWGGRELELTGEGGLTVSGPNGYFADFGTDAHNFDIVDGNTVVIDMATVIAEIEEEIKALEGVVDNTYYNGVYKFTLAKKTVKINGGNLGARAIADENVVYNDEAYLYYNVEFAAAEQEELEFDNKDFYPAANVKYYFTPDTEGELTWTVYENGEETNTIVVGGLYIVTTDGTAELLTPDESDAVEDTFGTYYTYATYKLEEGTEYYFQWTKNDGNSNYALYVTWATDQTTTPDDDQIVFNDASWQPTQDQPYYFTPEKNGTLVWTLKTIDGDDQKSFFFNDVIFNEDGTPVTPTTSDFENQLGMNYGSTATYKLEAGKKYYFVNQKNNDNEFFYLVTWTPDTETGILNVLEAVDGVYRVYNLQGVNVLNTENALDINDLQPGIYIVNGKKVMIRK